MVQCEKYIGYVSSCLVLPSLNSLHRKSLARDVTAPLLLGVRL